MNVRVYFCREPEADTLFQDEQISKQALDTIFDLVWDAEFKNLIPPGTVWLKFKEDPIPFGIPLRRKRSHERISAGDIIQIGSEFYMVTQTGTRKIKLN